MKTPRIEIVCVGSELLSGKVNSHATWVGQRLESIGLEISREHTVGDSPARMKEVFAEIFKRADVVISIGGLGPTFDDITREKWAEVLKRPLQLKVGLVDDIRRKFKSRGLEMPPENKRQGFILKGAQIIPNKNGTAPGQFLKIRRKLIFLLPGPRREMVPMLEQMVIPPIEKSFQKSHSLQKSYHLIGVPESKIDQLIRPVVAGHSKINGCQITHGILASNSVITVKFRVNGKSKGAVQKAASTLNKNYLKILEPYIFGFNDDTLPKVIGEVFKTKRKTLAVAESCTGGLISKLITDYPGASRFFIEGLTTYSYRSKMNRLGVKKETLLAHGAVSKEVAREMAEGLKKRSGADYALSITGVAGPTGGTLSKPVGMVVIGCATPTHAVVRDFRFKGDREWIRYRSALYALEFLRREIINA